MGVVWWWCGGVFVVYLTVVVVAGLCKVFLSHLRQTSWLQRLFAFVADPLARHLLAPQPRLPTCCCESVRQRDV